MVYTVSQLACLVLVVLQPALICPSDVRSYLKRRFRSLKCLVRTFGISDYLEDLSSNLTRGALDALPILLSQAPPSVDLLTALGRPFDSEVESRTPSTSLDVMDSIRDYLMVSVPSVPTSDRLLSFTSDTIPSKNKVSARP